MNIRYRATLFLLLCMLLPYRSTFAQMPITSEEQQIWTAYFNQMRFSKRWGMWLDVHLRTQEKFTKGYSQALFRPGITYHLNEQARITAGLAYIHHFPASGHRNIALPEYRPWMQLQWNQNHDRLRLMQWIRFEQRNKSIALNDSTRSESFSRIYRIRVNIMMQWPLIKKPGESGALFAILNNELMINAGKQAGLNIFDQNRFFAGFGYQVHKNHWIQVGYMNVFIQNPDGYSRRSIHVPRLFYFHNLNFYQRKS